MSSLNSMLVTLMPYSQNCLSLKTYTPQEGKQRFLVLREHLINVLGEGHPSCIDSDLYSFLALSANGGKVHFRLTLLKADGWRNAVSGCLQTFDLSFEDVQAALDGKTVRHVFSQDEEQSSATVCFSESGNRRVRELCADPASKRALLRFLRDRFRYGRDEFVTIFADPWSKDFLFSTSTGLNGGLVLHSNSVRGRDGKTHTCLEFGLHT